jgi:hypothetical protein
MARPWRHRDGNKATLGAIGAFIVVGEAVG